MLLHWANAHGGLVVWPRVGEATPPNPCKPLGLLAGPPPHHQVTSCPSCTSWGQVVSFYLSRLGKKPPAASDFHNFHMWSLKLKNHSIVIYISLDTMDTSLAPFGQVSRKLCMFKPPQSREPRPGHSNFKAMSRDSGPLKLSYLQAHTSY